jgi:sugar/nucleoside kinase (ribokinase family)
MTSSVLCAGIVVADHVSSPIAHLPAAGELVLADQLVLTIGGCAANVAVDLVKLGVPAGVVGCVGDDVFGGVVAEMLRQRQVDVANLYTRAGMVTSQTLIVNVQGQDRRFVHTFGANAAFSATDIPLDAPNCKVLYLGGYFLMERVRPRELAAVFARARQKGMRTVLDVVTPGPAKYLPGLVEVLPEVDVFLPNDHEAHLITGLEDPLAQAEMFHRMGATTAIITQGERGTVLVTHGLRLHADVFHMPFVDGTGGGDAFTAGYIAALLQNKEPVECLRMASAVGASCVRALGTTAGVFTAEECAAFLRDTPLKIERI